MCGCRLYQFVKAVYAFREDDALRYRYCIHEAVNSSVGVGCVRVDDAWERMWGQCRAYLRSCVLELTVATAVTFITWLRLVEKAVMISTIVIDMWCAFMQAAGVCSRATN